MKHVELWNFNSPIEEKKQSEQKKNNPERFKQDTLKTKNNQCLFILLLYVHLNKKLKPIHSQCQVFKLISSVAL